MTRPTLQYSFARLALLTATLAAAMVSGNAHADEHMARLTPPPVYVQECGACHVAYPAQFLPAASWQRVMSKLKQHYGTDASLDAPQAAAVSAWLSTHAANGRRAAQPAPEDRITRTDWFRNEHDEVADAVWKRPAVKSASNCAACHSQAAEGNFSEHGVRIPK
jgi:nitrate/TMAO reductase-like tetraheme cytochrome c subunit